MTPDPDTARRVVITGIGAITSQGEGVEQMWRGFCDGTVAIRPVRRFDLAGYRTGLGGEVRRAFPGDAALGFALTAAAEALGRRLPVPAERWGVVLGTCNAGLRSAELSQRDAIMVQPQVLAEAVSAEFGLKGPVLSVNTACASGAHAIAHAYEMVRLGRADAMLAGGTDAFSETAFAGFNSLESLSARPAAPYSKHRDGLSLGEGSGMLVLTTFAIARAAGTPILAEVLGYGLSSDGYHPTAPHPAGAGAARAIRAALSHAGLAAAAVDYINGHGTGTPKNDSAESNAVRLALGSHAEKVPLSSVKSMVGHLLGAAGAIEAIATVLALRDQVAPPTAGFTEPDPGCPLDPVPNTARPLPMEVALSNNFAFAGANAAVLYGRGAPPRRRPPRPLADEVVVTGVGVVTATASNRQELWQSYLDGESGAADVDGLRVARASLDPEAVATPKQRRRMDRLGLFAVAVCRRALEDARLEASERTGVVLGTGIGPAESLERFTIPVLERGPAFANPALFPNTVYNAAAGQVAMLLGALGPTSTVTSAHAAGASALAVAEDLLRSGHADAVVCPAVDALSTTALATYGRLFGGNRRFQLADGGIALVLERSSTAQARRARVLGVLRGHGMASDARGIGRWDRSGAGVERAMRVALETAGLGPGDVPVIWANATGLPSADRPETAAIERLLGPRVRVRRPKLVLGEPVGGGAHLSIALAVHAWSIGVDHGPALVNSSSLGGTHVCLTVGPDSREGHAS